MSQGITSSIVGGHQIMATGTAVLVGGTVDVTYAAATSSMLICLSVSTKGGTQGILSYTVTAGTKFTISSTSGTDTSTVVWAVIQ